MICYCGNVMTLADILADCGCCLLCLYADVWAGADAAYDDYQHEQHFGPADGWPMYTGESETSRANLGLGRRDE